MRKLIIKMLIEHEGIRLKPYHDITGKLTIGIGRNLDDCGISKEEALLLLENDIQQVLTKLQTIPIFNSLSESQQVALADMAFNLGFSGILKFKRMWAALEKGDFNLAAAEMLNSKWAKQLPARASELSQMLLEK